MDSSEKRAKHAAYMRQWYSDPDRKERHRQQAAERYRQNRDAILSARRAREDSGPRRRRWTDAELLQAIQDLAVDGVAACPKGGSIPGIAGVRYGSWQAACEAAGVLSAWRRPLQPTAKYSTVHSRLNRDRGTPQHCDECGVTEPTTRYEWALNLNVADPKFNEAGFPFSIDLADYRRLCKSCHIRQDKRRAS